MLKVSYNLCQFLTLLSLLCVNNSRCDDDEMEIPEQEVNPDYALIDDMIVHPEQYDVLYNNVTRRTGYTQVVRMWPNATVPYLLDNNFTAAEKSLIRAAQNTIQKESCVKFKRIHDPHSYKDFVHIKPGHGCASTVGFWGGRQIMYLQKSGCMDTGRILHEMIHVLGFFHMHTAYNRDKYIDVKWANIVPSSTVNFVSYETELSMYGTQYDYGSITHYPGNAFSKNSEDTIIAKEPGGKRVMGQRTHLSKGDITRLNRMYNCA